MSVFCRALLVAAAVLAAHSLGLAAGIDADIGEKEIEMGAQAAAEIAKQHKLSDNAEDLKRVREIGERIAAVANKHEMEALYGSSRITPFEYKFNIIEENDVNAFSVPGGHIYLYRGLLDFAESDDELAGVIAHEIVHAAHHHMVYLLRKQASLNNAMAVALLAVMVSGARSEDVGNIALGVQLYQIARLNGYGMQAEHDSDHGAIIYMSKAGYNPVGLLTFLERLARRPELVDYGIYRSHPLDSDRVKAARKRIQQMGLPINRRETTKAIKAEVRAHSVDGVEASELLIRDTVIYRPAPRDGRTSHDVAVQTAEKINAALDAGLKMHEIKVDPDTGAVIARGKPVMTVSSEDAKLMGKTPAQIAKQAAAAIREVVWKEMVDTVH